MRELDLFIAGLASLTVAGFLVAWWLGFAALGATLLAAAFLIDFDAEG